MTRQFDAYVRQGCALASARGLTWDMQPDINGMVSPERSWDLTKMTGAAVPPVLRLSNFSRHRGALAALKSRSLTISPEKHGYLSAGAISKAWRELIQSCVLEQLLLRRNTAQHVYANVLAPIRVLATCAIGHEPWELTVADATLAVEVGTELQASGKLGDLVFGLVKGLFDQQHLAEGAPLTPFMKRATAPGRAKRTKHGKSTDELQSDLSKRKASERLPERRALWELIRIVFTERPRTFLDNLRFSQTKLLILTGLRSFEGALLPLNWRQYRDYFDVHGRPASESGGMARSLSIRHFAGKQRLENDDSELLYVLPLVES